MEHRAIYTWLSWTRHLVSEPHSGYLKISSVVALAEIAHRLSLAYHCSLDYRHYRVFLTSKWDSMFCIEVSPHIEMYLFRNIKIW